MSIFEAEKNWNIPVACSQLNGNVVLLVGDLEEAVQWAVDAFEVIPLRNFVDSAEAETSVLVHHTGERSLGGFELGRSSGHQTLKPRVLSPQVLPLFRQLRLLLLQRRYLVREALRLFASVFNLALHLRDLGVHLAHSLLRIA